MTRLLKTGIKLENFRVSSDDNAKKPYFALGEILKSSARNRCRVLSVFRVLKTFMSVFVGICRFFVGFFVGFLSVLNTFSLTKNDVCLFILTFSTMIKRPCKH